MATFTKVGLGGILSFDTSSAMGSLGRVNRMFRSFDRSVRGFTSSARSFNRGFAVAAISLLPLAEQVGGLIDLYVRWEDQMKTVSSIANNMSVNDPKQFKALELASLDLAASTKFNPIETAQGLEVMSRAGRKGQMAIAGLRPILSAAAAENVNFARAASVVNDTVNAFELDTSTPEKFQAAMSRVANTMSSVASNANLDFTQLGESLKFVQGKAQIMGLSVEFLTGMIGSMGDKALKSGMAGRNLVSMFNALQSPKDSLKGDLRKAGFDIVNMSQGPGAAMKELDKVFDYISTRRKKDQQTILRDLGIRGERAAAVLMSKRSRGKIMDLFDLSTDAQKQDGDKKTLIDRKAEEQLSSIRGQWTIIKSLFDTSRIAIGKVAAKIFRVGDILNVIKLKGEQFWEIWKYIVEQGDGFTELPERFGKMGQVVMGILDGFREVNSLLISTWSVIEEQFNRVLGLTGEDGPRQIAKYVTMFLALATVITPVALGLAAVGFLFNEGLIPMIRGAIGMMRAFAVTSMSVLWPVAVVIGVVALAIQGMRREGESFGDAAMRIFEVVKVWALDLYYHGILPFLEGLQMAYVVYLPYLQAKFGELTDNVRYFVREAIALFAPFWNWIIDNASGIGLFIGSVFFRAFGFVSDIVSGFFRFFGDTIKDIRGVLEMFGHGVAKGFLAIGKMIVNLLIRAAASAGEIIASAVEMIAGSDNGIYKELMQDVADFRGATFKLTEDAPDPFAPDSHDNKDFDKRLDDSRNKFKEFQAQQNATGLAQATTPMTDELKAVNQKLDIQNAKDCETTVNMDGRRVGRGVRRAQQDYTERLASQSQWTKRNSARQGLRPALIEV